MRRTFLRRDLIFLACSLVVFVAALEGAALLFVNRSPSAPPPYTAPPAATAVPTATQPPPPPTPALVASPLDGALITPAEWEARRQLSPTAVMIDNSPEAFPQAGLDRADIVFEAYVEGGLTRLMAVFWRREAEVIAPVRSARTPFVIWASELDALYAHGGSAETLNAANAAGQIFEWNIKDIEAFAPWANTAFRRDPARVAPHDLTTGTAALRNVAATQAYAPWRAIEPWPFTSAPGVPNPSAPAEGIEVDFSDGSRHATRVVQWRWDRAASAFLRSRLGGPDTDALTGAQLKFTTVIVMRVPYESVDEAGHVLLDQFGEGDAIVFTGGRAVTARWRKKDRLSRTRFYDAFGQDVTFARGPIFIEVVGPQSPVVVAANAATLPPLPPYERQPLPGSTPGTGR